MPAMPRGPPMQSVFCAVMPDDLAEAERDDGQVVAAQPQRRCAEQDAGRASSTPIATGSASSHGQAGVLEVSTADGVGADGEEADVAEVEQAGLADHDVEPEGDAARRSPTVNSTRRRSRCPGSMKQRRLAAAAARRGTISEGDQQRPPRTRPAAGAVAAAAAALAESSAPAPAALACGRVRAHARALPRDSPSMPVGRNIRTSTSTEKATTSCHSVPNSAEP